MSIIVESFFDKNTKSSDHYEQNLLFQAANIAK